MRFALSRKI